MKEKICQLIKKYKHLIYYGIFGILTTLVNIAVYYICSHILKLDTVPSTIIAWIFAVLFAYVTNRKWVFESTEHSATGILYEILKFFFFRAATGVLDVVVMYVTVDLLGWNDVLMKIISNILVIVLNYIASKLVIFRHKEKD